ncbi:MAG: SpoIIE family protein phosphatase [Frankiaceae bacterium]|nr:SpoIIE family protein phosphatase [Frankiaceae bacterium]MBV9368420.1 SpoIIE family protein phosphatase [Frankiales bacterium]
MSGLPTQPAPVPAYPSAGPVADPPESTGAAGAADRLARLQAVTARLARAQTVAEVARVAVTTGANAVGADAAMIASLTPDRRVLHVHDTAGYDDAVVAAYATFAVDDALPAADAARTGEPVVIATDAELHDRYPNLAAVGSGRVHIALPLFGHGRTVGALGFSWAGNQPPPLNDLSFLETVAQQIGSTLDRARLYDASIETAQTLQRTLLPAQLPVVAGLQIAARYQPLDDSAVVGGDFYDVFRRGDQQTYGLSIGDVSGKGVEAASLTALARHTIRAASRRSGSPASVLADLNDAVLADDRQDRYMTVAHLVLRPEQMVTHVTLSLGGHPLPLLRTADRAVRTVGRPGSAVGLLDRGQWHEDHLSLAAGNVLVLYTDGLTDVRNPETGELAGDLLADVLAASDATDAETLADELLNAVLAFAGGARRDDMALLVLYPA